MIELANIVKENIDIETNIIQTKSDDNRSYHISYKKIKDILGFETKKTIEDAIPIYSYDGGMGFRP